MDLRMGSRGLSLHEYIDDEGDSAHIDFLAYEGDNQETHSSSMRKKSLVHRNIAGALAKLNERESYIIRHGSWPTIQKLFRKSATNTIITRERARQIEKQALKKVQLALPYLKPDK
jgi:RNA polymerase sigma-32 factor